MSSTQVSGYTFIYHRKCYTQLMEQIQDIDQRLLRVLYLCVVKDKQFFKSEIKLKFKTINADKINDQIIK